MPPDSLSIDLLAGVGARVGMWARRAAALVHPIHGRGVPAGLRPASARRGRNAPARCWCSRSGRRPSYARRSGLREGGSCRPAAKPSPSSGRVSAPDSSERRRRQRFDGRPNGAKIGAGGLPSGRYPPRGLVKAGDQIHSQPCQAWGNPVARSKAHDQLMNRLRRQSRASVTREFPYCIRTMTSFASCALIRFDRSKPSNGRRGCRVGEKRFLRLFLR